MYENVYRSVICNSKILEVVKMFIIRGMRYGIFILCNILNSC